MKKTQIKQWMEKAYEYDRKSDLYAQKVGAECQKYCDFEIKFVQNDPGDGLVLVYDTEDYTDCHFPADYFIKMYEKLKRKITLNDLYSKEQI